MSKLSSWKTIFLFCVFGAATAIASPAQTDCSVAAPCFKTVVNFSGTDGSDPIDQRGVVQGTDGNYYGTAAEGGNTAACFPGGCGTVFKIITTSTLTTLHSFDGKDGSFPAGGLVLATDGNFYGTTAFGGDLTCNAPNGCGTVFKITPGRTFTTLHIFGGTDGETPYAGLVQATDGNFYGTTWAGGAHGDGTVFKITSGGTLTSLHSFDITDGERPYAALIQATDGNFYGTTESGGTHGDGTVFKITSGGTLTSLHSFDFTDGEDPHAGLIQAINGNFYGTTETGGAHGDGTVFKITPGGSLTTLHSFDITDGAAPDAGLVQGTDGNFYGTTSGGGTNDDGTVFEITAGGTLTTVHRFDVTDGCCGGGLVQATNGNFYGTTPGGGTHCCDGTIFSLSVGLGPFVETLPTSGKLGTAVIILGNNLTGATSVTFNGKSAMFKVVSNTEIKTTVPSGATSGKVKVVTPKGTLTSNVNFRVTP